MNKYTIIEDCSPYYIRFTHDNIDEIINFCKEELSKVTTTTLFTHHKLDLENSEKLIKLIPMSTELKIIKERVSLFISKPGFYYRPHKDGIDHRISLNYAVEILDTDCVTSWYSDDELKNYPLEGLSWENKSREVKGFIKNKDKHTPVKSMTAKPNECVLFNTDIFHSFDNTKSKNSRTILTLRVHNPGVHYFDDVKKILFGL